MESVASDFHFSSPFTGSHMNPVAEVEELDSSQ